MRRIERSTSFKKDFKRVVRGQGGHKISALLTDVLEKLAKDEPLPAKNADHPLAGEWTQYRDCHIKPDLVLIYRKLDADTLQLVRLGSHSELFG